MNDDMMRPPILISEPEKLQLSKLARGAAN